MSGLYYSFISNTVLEYRIYRVRHYKNRLFPETAPISVSVLFVIYYRPTHHINTNAHRLGYLGTINDMEAVFIISCFTSLSLTPNKTHYLHQSVLPHVTPYTKDHVTRTSSDVTKPSRRPLQSGSASIKMAVSACPQERRRLSITSGDNCRLPDSDK